MNGELTSNLSPKVFWLLIGTNDLGEDRCSVESIVAGNIGIVLELQRRRPTSKILVNSLLPRTQSPDGTLGPMWQSIQSINQILESYIQPMENVHFFNATNLFLKDYLTIDMRLMPDLLHPSAYGS
jgi:lysophospholipase L1-like esterase